MGLGPGHGGGGGRSAGVCDAETVELSVALAGFHPQVPTSRSVVSVGGSACVSAVGIVPRSEEIGLGEACASALAWGVAWQDECGLWVHTF